MDITLSITHPTALLGLSRAATAAGKSVEELAQQVATDAINAIVGQNIVSRVEPFDFLNRFTQDERAMIRTASLGNGQLADYIAMVSAAKTVVLTDELTMTGVQALEAAGLIASGRAAEILAL
jgi:hypothetical protein